jgi:hypothetical protein
MAGGDREHMNMLEVQTGPQITTVSRPEEQNNYN